ncbi:hypothetical protein [Halalkalibacter alkalisediminis]|uniref:Uncharacterized protein n=1 Tax=Halalkalibacter alkalisediminis TaxID=935616 RepID=A0ABV6NCF5_9BACI|nr:hypothetical protein [Halalkalibacter alkalisediminis]
MELLDRLKEQYQWQEVKFVNEALIETELGRKRLRYWSDRALLDWHIAWRDSCSVTPYMLADRMIRNKDQDAQIEWKEGWVTVHDEVDASFRHNPEEKKISQMIGSMIQYGVRATADVEPTIAKEPRFQQVQKDLPSFHEDQQSLIQSLLKESEVRLKKAEALQTSLNKVPVPLLDPVTSSDQAKMIHQVFIWFGSKSYPERGYYSLRSFLVSWLDQFGEDSCQHILDELFEHEAMTREQSILLLAECLKPYELDRLVHVLRKEPTEAELAKALELVLKEWEHSKTLVQEMSALIDKKKKVVPS